MDNLIVVLIIVAILAVAIAYIVRAKKSGVKCIGCTASGQCKSKSCHCHSELTEQVADVNLEEQTQSIPDLKTPDYF